MPFFRSLAATTLLAVAQLASAQTWSDCNPMKQSGCPSKLGLTQDFSVDFTQGSAGLKEFTTTSGAVAFGNNGAEFKISKLGDGPTIQSNFYLFYGKVEVVMQAAPGAGIISSWLLQSDDLDEVDWEFVGSHNTEGQSNYFGKGNTTTYDRGQTHAISAPTSSFHTYALDWNKDTIVWSIDGTPVRTTTYASALGGKNYPQTPMNVRIGNWVAGDPKNNKGTIDWAGGLTDFSKGPFSMFVKSIKVTNYNPAASYTYGDMSGSSDSIKLNGPVEKGTPTSSISTKQAVSSSPSDNAATSATVIPTNIPSGDSAFKNGTTLPPKPGHGHGHFNGTHNNGTSHAGMYPKHNGSEPCNDTLPITTVTMTISSTVDSSSTVTVQPSTTAAASATVPASSGDNFGLGVNNGGSDSKASSTIMAPIAKFTGAASQRSSGGVMAAVGMGVVAVVMGSL